MDRKEAVEWIEKAMEYMGLLPSEFWIDGEIGEAVDLAVEALQEPTPVRCKDCRYAQDDVFHLFCELKSHKVMMDDYCSYGERRDHGQD